jgi:hypothetical protein
MPGYISKVKAAKDKLGYDPFDQINDPGVPCEQQRILSPEEEAWNVRLRARYNESYPSMKVKDENSN